MILRKNLRSLQLKEETDMRLEGGASFAPLRGIAIKLIFEFGEYIKIH